MTFMTLCTNGKAELDDIDDWIERWHESGGAGGSLYDHLGMTRDEYAVWLAVPSSLPLLLQAAKLGIRIEQLLTWDRTDVDAIRRRYHVEAAETIDWMRHAGRLDGA